jgi:hypothetical protein
MTEHSGQQPHVVAIGGVGGSGTRLGAAVLQMLGYYIGGDLNEALDNLWFTLLFKRRSILLECRPEFCSIAALFFARMSGQANFSDAQRARVLRMVHDERLQHSRDWLRRRADSFLDETGSSNARQLWGWKEPNTHIVIDRLFEFHPDLRYIHFVRHPLDMALSANQNQLQNWGPVILSHDVANEPHQSLAYWCAAHRRISAVMRQWPERTIIVDFDEFRADPDKQCHLLASFVGVTMPHDLHAKLAGLFDHSRPSSRRFKTTDLSQFVSEDLSYVRELGYRV